MRRGHRARADPARSSSARERARPAPRRGPQPKRPNASRAARPSPEKLRPEREWAERARRLGWGDRRLPGSTCCGLSGSAVAGCSKGAGGISGTEAAGGGAMLPSCASRVLMRCSRRIVRRRRFSAITNPAIAQTGIASASAIRTRKSSTATTVKGSVKPIGGSNSAHNPAVFLPKLPQEPSPALRTHARMEVGSSARTCPVPGSKMRMTRSMRKLRNSPRRWHRQRRYPGCPRLADPQKTDRSRRGLRSGRAGKPDRSYGPE